MLTNPDHKAIKALALNMLLNMDHCPDGKQKVCNDLLPIAEFANGLITPNASRPNAVYVELDGVLWRHMRAGKQWRQA
jgi:hypothetical protein